MRSLQIERSKELTGEGRHTGPVRGRIEFLVRRAWSLRFAISGEHPQRLSVSRHALQPTE